MRPELTPKTQASPQPPSKWTILPFIIQILGGLGMPCIITRMHEGSCRKRKQEKELQDPLPSLGVWHRLPATPRSYLRPTYQSNPLDPPTSPTPWTHLPVQPLDPATSPPTSPTPGPMSRPILRKVFYSQYLYLPRCHSLNWARVVL